MKLIPVKISSLVAGAMVLSLSEKEYEEEEKMGGKSLQSVSARVTTASVGVYGKWKKNNNSLCGTKEMSSLCGTRKKREM